MEVLVLVLSVLVLVTVVSGVVASVRRERGIEEHVPPEAPEAPPAGHADVPGPSSGVGLAPRPGESPPTEDDPTLTAPEPDRRTVAEIEDALAQAVEPEQAEAVKPSFRERLTKARSLLAGYVSSVLSRAVIDEETWAELEEALVRADVGVRTTATLIEDLRREAAEEQITDPEALLTQLKGHLKARLALGDRSLRFESGSPNVWLFVGVNGVGKTTTIAKVGKQQQEGGRAVVMAAGDTFRAAATEQLERWARRVQADMVRGAEGGDPSSVIFDAVQRAAATDAQLVLADTAGRLHTKVNLMEELRKVRRVAEKPPGRVTEVLLVLDATTGQNGLAQARQFTEAVEVTGVVLTKLDGSAKGGIVLAIQTELGIPVKLVGLGETVDDLVEFDPDEFVEALLS
ncbi:MAG: signal recognition particle-docking protein FtsY [Acidimicrobiales bacterium]